MSNDHVPAFLEPADGPGHPAPVLSPSPEQAPPTKTGQNGEGDESELEDRSEGEKDEAVGNGAVRPGELLAGVVSLSARMARVEAASAALSACADQLRDYADGRLSYITGRDVDELPAAMLHVPGARQLDRCRSTELYLLADWLDHRADLYRGRP